LVKRKDRAVAVAETPTQTESVRADSAGIDPWAPVVPPDEMDVSEPAA
jgi:hypothetical protein